MSQSILLLVLLVSIGSWTVDAKPPPAPKGYKWVQNWQYSDEFNGNALNKAKWRDYHTNWEGRSPARFEPSTISVRNGFMMIKNGVLNPPKGKFTIAGGAVQSKNSGAHYGYYECRLKASKIMMSTTFWLSNTKAALNGSRCATYSQELDVVETIGGRKGKFSESMKSNTHYKYRACGAKQNKYHSAGAQKRISGQKSGDAFHIYGAWWKNAYEVTFYLDNKKGDTVKFSTEVDRTKPFDRPMRINMVTETYDFATPYPSRAQLRNNTINTSYYDWVRSWRLVKA